VCNSELKIFTDYSKVGNMSGEIKGIEFGESRLKESKNGNETSPHQNRISIGELERIILGEGDSASADAAKKEESKENLANFLSIKFGKYSECVYYNSLQKNYEGSSMQYKFEENGLKIRNSIIACAPLIYQVLSIEASPRLGKRGHYNATRSFRIENGDGNLKAVPLIPSSGNFYIALDNSNTIAVEKMLRSAYLLHKA